MPQSLAGALTLVLLAFGGHALALQLIDVKPYAAYQHYETWQWIAAERPLAATALLVQTIIVVSLGWRVRHALVAIVTGLLSRRRALVFLALAGFSLAVPTESVSRFLSEVVLAGALAAVSALNLALAALALPDSVTSRAVAWLGDRVTLGPTTSETRRWDRLLPAAAAILVAILSATASYVVLERVSHIEDGVSNLFQAKYFASGHLYLPAPPDVRSFQVDQTVIREGKWFGYAFPGWPAVLAIGVLAGAPWLVNPILAGILILVGHDWVRRRTDRGTANLAILPLTASSWLIFTSAELMGHPLTALLVLVVLWAFDRAIDVDHRWGPWSVLSGLATGMVLLTRAFDGVLVAAALSLMVVIHRRSTRAWRALVTAGAIAACVAALILPYNRAVTGDATYPAHQAWTDVRYGPGIDVLGFGPSVGILEWPNLDPLPGHGVADVVLNWNKNLFMVNADLFGWAPGSLIFVWLAFAIGSWRRADIMLLALPAIYLFGYSLFWFSGGPDIGARYWYPILIPFAALSARGVRMVSTGLSALRALTHPAARVGAFIVAATVGSAVVMLPWRATTKHYRYRGITGEVRELAAAHGFEHALVFVRGEQNRRDYPEAFTFNPWTLERPETIYAYDAGPSNRAVVVAHYSDRPIWVIGRDPQRSVEAPPLRVIAGPLPPGTVPP
ncbi:MAG: hypothetical protein ACRD2N_25205 [Vicinamibacterales bacterium]